MARMAAFWSLTVLIFYGCTSLRAELAGRVAPLGRPLFAAIHQHLVVNSTLHQDIGTAFPDKPY